MTATTLASAPISEWESGGQRRTPPAERRSPEPEPEPIGTHRSRKRTSRERSMAQVIPLDDVLCCDPAIVGGKAVNL
jgi:hypothetical protein